MPTLEQLQAAEQAQAQARLRSTMALHAATLERLPTLHAEMRAWLDDSQLDLEILAEHMQGPLQAASDFWVQHDALPADVRQQASLQSYTQRLAEQARSGNLRGLLSTAALEFSTAQQSAKIQAEERQRRQAEAQAAERARQAAAEQARAEAAQRRAQEEAARQAEAEEAARREAARESFLDNGDGTVTDPKTRLMWKVELEEGKFYWSQTMALFGAGKPVRFASYSDWRLPTIDELKTLLRSEKPHINEVVFPGGAVPTWSATPEDSLASFLLALVFSPLFILGWLLTSNRGEKAPFFDIFLTAWLVNFGVGSVDDYYRGHGGAVRLVRASQ